MHEDWTQISKLIKKKYINFKISQKSFSNKIFYKLNFIY